MIVVVRLCECASVQNSSGRVQAGRRTARAICTRSLHAYSPRTHVMAWGEAEKADAQHRILCSAGGRHKADCSSVGALGTSTHVGEVLQERAGLMQARRARCEHSTAGRTQGTAGAHLSTYWQHSWPLPPWPWPPRPKRRPPGPRAPAPLPPSPGGRGRSPGGRLEGPGPPSLDPSAGLRHTADTHSIS